MNVLIVGGGQAGTNLLQTFERHDSVCIVGVVDLDEKAEGVKLARLLGVPVSTGYRGFLSENDIDLVIDTTGTEAVYKDLLGCATNGCQVVGGNAALFVLQLLEQRRRDSSQAESLLAEHRALYHIGLILSSTDDLSEVFKTIVEHATMLTTAPAGSLAVFDEKNGEMYLGAAKGFSGELTQRWPVRPGGLTSYILNQKTPVIINNLAEYPEFDNPNVSSERVLSLVACPLFIENRIVGIVYVDDFKGREWKEREISALVLLSTYAAVAIERAKFLEETRLLAITDDLTQLYNHRYFVQRLNHELNRSKRYGLPLSLVMLDIDFFKTYNDHHGHIKGNEVLRGIAEVIKRQTREADIPVRYGGEEFAVILPQTGGEEALAFAERLRRRVEAEPFPEKHTQPGNNLTVSLGVAAFPNDANQSGQLIELADTALYRAKQLGKNRVCEAEATKV